MLIGSQYNASVELQFAVPEWAEKNFNISQRWYEGRVHAPYCTTRIIEIKELE